MVSLDSIQFSTTDQSKDWQEKLIKTGWEKTGIFFKKKVGTTILMLTEQKKDNCTYLRIFAHRTEKHSLNQVDVITILHNLGIK